MVRSNQGDIPDSLFRASLMRTVLSGKQVSVDLSQVMNNCNTGRGKKLVAAGARFPPGRLLTWNEAGTVSSSDILTITYKYDIQYILYILEAGR